MSTTQQSPHRLIDAEFIAPLERLMETVTRITASIENGGGSKKVPPGYQLVVHDGVEGCEFANGRTLYFVEVESYRQHLVDAIDEWRKDETGDFDLQLDVFKAMVCYQRAIEALTTP